MELQLPVMMEAMEDFAVNQLALNQGGKPERRRAIAKYPRD